MKDLKAVISLKVRDAQDISKEWKKAFLEDLESQTINNMEEALDFIKSKGLASHISSKDFLSKDILNNKEVKESSLFRHLITQDSITTIVFGYIFAVIFIIFMESMLYCLGFQWIFPEISNGLFKFIMIVNAIIGLIIVYLFAADEYNNKKDYLNKLVGKIIKSGDIPEKEKKVANNNIKKYFLFSYSDFISKLIEKGEYAAFGSTQQIEDIYFSIKNPKEHTVKNIIKNKKELSDEEKESIEYITSNSSTFNKFLENLSKEKLIDKFNQNELANIQNTYK